MNKEYSFLSDDINLDINTLHKRGYQWFSKILSLALKESKISDKILSSWYMILGDIWYLNDMPMAAKKYYELSNNLDSSIGCLELLEIFEDIGEYSKTYNQMIEWMNKGVYENLSLLEEFEIKIKNNEEPLFNLNDKYWKLNELLALGKFTHVLELLNSDYSVEALKLKAKCYGALNDKSNFINSWEKVLEMGKSIEIDYSDWFFTPSLIYNDSTFWEVLLKFNVNIAPSIFIDFESLTMNYRELKLSEKRKVICQYYIAIINDNHGELIKLNKKFPLWNEAYLALNSKSYN